MPWVSESFAYSGSGADRTRAAGSGSMIASNATAEGPTMPHTGCSTSQMQTSSSVSPQVVAELEVDQR